MQTPQHDTISNTESDHNTSQTPKIGWLTVVLVTLFTGALSLGLIVFNNLYLQWPIHESLWCVIAMLLASVYFLLRKLMAMNTTTTQ